MDDFEDGRRVVSYEVRNRERVKINIFEIKASRQTKDFLLTSCYKLNISKKKIPSPPKK